METKKENEIVLYQPNETIRLEVRVYEESVWLTQAQMAVLFGTTTQNITLHIRNIYKECELQQFSTCKDFLQVRDEGGRIVRRNQKLYNLDVIISVGYRVKSLQGTYFRQWANAVLKDYLLRGYAFREQLQTVQMEIDTRFDEQSKRMFLLEEKVNSHQEKIDFFIRTNQPPVEGVLFEGQVLDARLFAENLIKTAQKEIVLIDNYIDAKTFDILETRNQGVMASIYVEKISRVLTDLQNLAFSQYGRTVELHVSRTKVHDRFLIIDGQVYHLGASLKDLGMKLFAFSKMSVPEEIIMSHLK